MGGRQVVDGEEDVLGPEVLGALSVAQGEQEQLRVADLVGMTQRQMSVKVDLHQQRRLMEMVGEGEEREQARLLAVALDHTGDWLNTPPAQGARTSPSLLRVYFGHQVSPGHASIRLSRSMSRMSTPE